jgi:lipopolysaccharide export system protein LptA
MSSPALRVSLLGLAFLLAVTELAGQRSCDLTSSRRLELIQTNDGYVTYTSAPRINCDDGTSIRADSSVYHESTSFYELFGNVVFREVGRELNADRAQYFERVGRLQAQGSVRLVNLENGSWVTGDDLLLLQEGDDRAEDDVTVRGGRPHASIVSRAARDSTDVIPGAAQAENLSETSQVPAPYEVDADLIHLVGDHLFQARGRVEIRQETLHAYGDSLEFQQDIGWLTLFDNARILSQDTVSGDTLDVRGDTITMNLPDDQIDEIEARGRAHLLADDLEMRAPVIRLVFREEELERVFGVRRAVEEGLTPVIAGDLEYASSGNRAQPEVLAEDLRLTGDSIEANLPGGELERVFAAGTARGVSSARDSLNTEDTPELIRYDWIEGDTIIATFSSTSVDLGDPGPGGVEVAEPRERQLDLLIARVQARAFYRVAPDSVGAGVAAGGAAGPQPFDIHYLLGDEVRLFMKEGEIDRMEADSVTGVVLRPTNQSGPPVAAPEPSGGAPPPPGADGQPPPVDNGPPTGNGAGNGGGNGAGNGGGNRDTNGGVC